jgi:hypothetical protein
MLDIAYVDTFFEEEGGHGVAEHVGGDVAGDTGLGGVAAEHGADRLLREAAAKAVVEKVAVFGFLVRSAEESVVAEGSQGPEGIGQLEDALARSLAQDANAAPAEVHVFEAKVADLGDAGAGGEEDLEDGDVPDQRAETERVSGLARLLRAVEMAEEALEIGQRNGARQALGFLDPNVHLPKGVDGDRVLSLQEVEERLKRGDLALDAFLGQRAEEALDVAPERGLIDGLEGECGSSGGQMIDELPEIDGIGLEGLRTEVLFVAAVEKELRDRFRHGHPSPSPVEMSDEES